MSQSPCFADMLRRYTHTHMDTHPPTLTHTHTHRISHSYAVTAKKVILEYCVPFARLDGIAAALTTRVSNAPRK